MCQCFASVILKISISCSSFHFAVEYFYCYFYRCHSIKWMAQQGQNPQPNSSSLRNLVFLLQIVFYLEQGFAGGNKYRKINVVNFAQCFSEGLVTLLKYFLYYVSEIYNCCLIYLQTILLSYCHWKCSLDPKLRLALFLSFWFSIWVDFKLLISNYKDASQRDVPEPQRNMTVMSSLHIQMLISQQFGILVNVPDSQSSIFLFVLW